MTSLSKKHKTSIHKINKFHRNNGRKIIEKNECDGANRLQITFFPSSTIPVWINCNILGLITYTQISLKKRKKKNLFYLFQLVCMLHDQIYRAHCGNPRTKRLRNANAIKIIELARCNGKRVESNKIYTKGSVRDG